MLVEGNVVAPSTSQKHWGTKSLVHSAREQTVDSWENIASKDSRSLSLRTEIVRFHDWTRAGDMSTVPLDVLQWEVEIVWS